MDWVKIAKGLVKVGSMVSEIEREAIEKRKNEFRENAIAVRCREDVSRLMIGDAVCVVDDFMGIIVSKNGPECRAIPFIHKRSSTNWYTYQVYMIPNIRRTDSSYMNSISHWIITDAKNYDDGKKNQEEIMKYLEREKESRDRHEFPAFEYCNKMGKGYYLPAISELKTLFESGNISVINDTLKQYRIDPLIPIEGEISYWSSTDDVEQKYEGLHNSYSSDSAAYALSVDSNGKIDITLQSKQKDAYVLPFFVIRF